VVTRAGLNSDQALRDRLASAGEEARDPRSPAELLEEAACRLMEFRRRVPAWSFEDQGFALIVGGLDRVYRDMREAEKRAAREPTAANFHEWRKQVKHHAAHISLLRDTAPDILKAYGKVAKELADILGEHHDLDVLLGRLAADADSPRGEREALSEATAIRHRQLEKEAFRLGEELAAEKPSDFIDRMAHSWKAWRD
jgi:CHAD domain-containing protein